MNNPKRNLLNESSTETINESNEYQEPIIQPIINLPPHIFWKVRKNLIIYSSIFNFFLGFKFISPGDLKISIYGIELLVPQHIFYIILLFSVIYNLIYFMIMSYESILHNKLQLTRIFRFKPNDFCEDLLYRIDNFIGQYEENEKNIRNPDAPRFSRDEPKIKRCFIELEDSIKFFKDCLSAIDRPYSHYQILDKLRYGLLDLGVPFLWALFSLGLYTSYLINSQNQISWGFTSNPSKTTNYWIEKVHTLSIEENKVDK